MRNTVMDRFAHYFDGSFVLTLLNLVLCLGVHSYLSKVFFLLSYDLFAFIGDAFGWVSSPVVWLLLAVIPVSIVCFVGGLASFGTPLTAVIALCFFLRVIQGQRFRSKQILPPYIVALLFLITTLLVLRLNWSSILTAQTGGFKAKYPDGPPYIIYFFVATSSVLSASLMRYFSKDGLNK